MASESKKIILYAPNINSGGGLVLLKALLSSITDQENMKFILDDRVRNAGVGNGLNSISWVRPSVISRVAAQLSLRKLTNADTFTIFLNGIPPVIPIRGTIIVFVQNRLHLIRPNFLSYGLKIAARLLMEKIICYTFRGSVSLYMVQTPSMVEALIKWYGGRTLPEYVIFPFVGQIKNATLIGDSLVETKWDFIYIADGLSHKNHRKLLAAWTCLAKDGLRPRLALTLAQSETSLLTIIDVLRAKYGLEVYNLGDLPHKELLNLYDTSRALIYPSLTESFGLPLIEASALGIPIVASELDYVRDVCKPIETFDPTSEVSIARAVRRYLNQEEDLVQIRTPEKFWQYINNYSLDKPSH
jgi:glycosyltransferase involved in cell wall biosynthesis